MKNWKSNISISAVVLPFISILILGVTSSFNTSKIKILRKKCFVVYFKGDSIIKMQRKPEFTMTLEKNNEILKTKIKNGEIFIDEKFLNDSALIDIMVSECGYNALFTGQNPKGLKSTKQLVLKVYINPQDVFYKEECYSINYNDCRNPRGYVLEYTNFYACQQLCLD